MTKAEIVSNIAKSTGVDKKTAMIVVESFMDEIMNCMASEENIYLRGFGTFVVKHRAEKTARNITTNTTIIVPAHNFPAFKPAQSFAERLLK